MERNTLGHTDMSKRYWIIVNHEGGAEVERVEGKVNAEARLEEILNSLAKEGKKVLSKFVEERTRRVKRTDS